MTCNVFGGMLNLAVSIYPSSSPNLRVNIPKFEHETPKFPSTRSGCQDCSLHLQLWLSDIIQVWN